MDSAESAPYCKLIEVDTPQGSRYDYWYLTLAPKPILAKLPADGYGAPFEKLSPDGTKFAILTKEPSLCIYDFDAALEEVHD